MTTGIKMGEAFVDLRYRVDQLARDLTTAKAKVGQQVDEMKREVVQRTSGMFDGVTKQLDGVSTAISTVRNLAVVAFAVQAAQAAYTFARSIAQAGTEARLLQARLAGITGDARAFDMAKESADRLGLAVRTTADTMARFAMAGREIGLTTGEVQKLTEVVVNLGRLSGSSGQELESAAFQLSQALASGTLQGDELRSILENMPALAKVLAEELGVGVGQLRALGAEGKLTSEVVATALLGAFDGVSRKIEELPPTMEQASARMANAWQEVLAGLDQALGVSKALLAIYEGLANVGDATASGVEALAVLTGGADEATTVRVLEDRLKALQAERDRIANGPDLLGPIGSSARTVEEITGELREVEQQLGAIRLAALALPDPLVPPTSADIARQAAGPKAVDPDAFIALSDVGPARPELLPDSGDIARQIAATERAEAEKTRIEEEAERERETKRRARGAEARAAREREAAAAAALLRALETPQEAYSRKVEEAAELRRKQLLTEEQYQRVVAAAEEAKAKASENAVAARKRLELEAEGAQVMEATRTAAERYAAELERLQELQAAGAIDTQTYTRATIAAGEGLAKAEAAARAERERALRDQLQAKEDQDEATRELRLRYDPAFAMRAALDEYLAMAEEKGTLAGEALADGLQTAESALSGFLQNVATGEDVFSALGDAAEDFGRRMLDVLADIAAQQVITGILGSFAGAGFASTASPAATASRTPGGGAQRFGYQGMVLEPMARGGIVKAATIVPLSRGAAVIGEKRPEGVLPLERDSQGNLGVKAVGGAGGNMTVNVIDQRGSSAPPIERRERTGAGGSTVDLVIREATEKNLHQGRHDRLFNQRFGMREVPVR